MSEPTPLTAALERAISARLLERPPTDPGEFPEFVAHVRAQLGYKDATIDAQATEIAALKGALEKVEAFCDPGELPVQPPETIAALGTEFLRGFEMGTAVAKSYLWFEVLGRRGKTLDEIKAARVLAGKEAQR